MWVSYVAFVFAAQTSPLIEKDQYTIRKKLFNIIFVEANLPRIAIPRKETKNVRVNDANRSRTGLISIVSGRLATQMNRSIALA